MSVVLTREQYFNLVNGNFTMHQCTHCDGKGWYYVHDDGTKRNPVAGENLDEFYQHECSFDDDDDECGGHGFRVVYR